MSVVLITLVTLAVVAALITWSIGRLTAAGVALERLDPDRIVRIGGDLELARVELRASVQHSRSRRDRTVADDR